MPAVRGVDADGSTGPGAGTGPAAAVVPALARLDEILGIGPAAATAARTGTFLGERYRLLVKRIGKLKALVAVASTMLVIIWHLLADPAAPFRELGSGYHATHIDTQRKARGHTRQLESLGYTVTLTPAA